MLRSLIQLLGVCLMQTCMIYAGSVHDQCMSNAHWFFTLIVILLRFNVYTSHAKVHRLFTSYAMIKCHKL